jgi:hypothetical protein
MRPVRPNCHGDIEMARKGLFASIGHAVVVAAVAAVTLTAAGPAVAETGSSSKGLSVAPATRDASDFSGRRRYYREGHRAVVAGAGLAIATPRIRRAYDGDYECTPVHCGPNYKREGAYSGYGAPIFTGW